MVRTHDQKKKKMCWVNKFRPLIWDIGKFLTSGAIRQEFPPLLTHQLLKGSLRPKSSARQHPKSVITSLGHPALK